MSFAVVLLNITAHKYHYDPLYEIEIPKSYLTRSTLTTSQPTTTNTTTVTNKSIIYRVSSSNEIHEVTLNADLLKYLLIIIISVLCLIPFTLCFIIIKLICKKYCKSYRIKSRFIMGECGCLVCICHKYKAKQFNRKENTMNKILIIKDDKQNLKKLTTINKNKIKTLEDLASSDIKIENECDEDGLDLKRGSLVKKLYLDYLQRVKIANKRHKLEQLFRIMNVNSASSDMLNNFFHKNENISSTEYKSDTNLYFRNNDKKFLTNKLKETLVYHIVNEKLNEYTDVDFGYLTNDLALNDSYLVSETSI